MFAKLKHLAIVSDQYALLGRFYEALFGMKPSPDNHPAGAIVVSDGYIGLNINPRKGKAGRQAGLDHFGFEVEDVDRVFTRLRENYPTVEVSRGRARGSLRESARTIQPVMFLTFRNRGWKTGEMCMWKK